MLARKGLTHKSLLATLMGFLVLSCSESIDDPTAALPALGLWTQPPSSVPIMNPADMKASTREVVWLAEAVTKVVMRLNTPAGDFEMFGYLDAEPVELVDPYRLAVAPDLGVFVYDRATGMVDHYTPAGQHIRGFPLGFEPITMALARRPFSLVYAMASEGEQPTLLLLRTDLQGSTRDTLLGPRTGPQPIRALDVAQGETRLAPSGAGMWLWSADVPDTVFEVAAMREGRRLALRDADLPVQAILSDPEEELLWLARRDSAGLRYAAYDVAGVGTLEAGSRFVGIRTTPSGFTPQQVVQGAVIGWVESGDRSRPFLTAAYDLRVELLRRPK